MWSRVCSPLTVKYRNMMTFIPHGCWYEYRVETASPGQCHPGSPNLWYRTAPNGALLLQTNLDGLVKMLDRNNRCFDSPASFVLDGVSKDRIVSVYDREMRHGHKSSRRRFDGHKAAVMVDTDT